MNGGCLKHNKIKFLSHVFAQEIAEDFEKRVTFCLWKQVKITDKDCLKKCYLQTNSHFTERFL